MSTTISRPTQCTWCNCWMNRGEKCWQLRTDKFKEHIQMLVAAICNKHSTMNVDVGVQLHLLSFIIPPSKWRRDYACSPYCTDCGHFDIKFTRSGRIVLPPMRLQDEIFVSGSGFSGCDHYDGGYDRGAIDGKRDWASNANLTGFIVDDDEPIDHAMHCKRRFSESDEEDSASDFISDEEEEFDSDMDWD